MIERYLIRYFLAIIDHGSFSKAAAACNVSQPTLSTGIAKLERMLGSPLLLRSNQRVELTPAGAGFQVHARRIEREFHLALQSMAAEPGSSALRIGVLMSVPGQTIAAALQSVETAQALAGVEIVSGSERELVGHLARGRIDLALTLVERGGDRFREIPIHSEGYALALPVTHHLSASPALSAEDVASEVMIVRRHCEALSETSRFFTERGVRPRFSYKSTNDERVMQMVSAGLGITVMPECYQWPGVSRPKLFGFGSKRRLGLAFALHAEEVADAQPAIVKALATAFIDSAANHAVRGHHHANEQIAPAETVNEAADSGL